MRVSSSLIKRNLVLIHSKNQLTTQERSYGEGLLWLAGVEDVDNEVCNVVMIEL